MDGSPSALLTLGLGAWGSGGDPAIASQATACAAQAFSGPVFAMVSVLRCEFVATLAVCWQGLLASLRSNLYGIFDAPAACKPFSNDRGTNRMLLGQISENNRLATILNNYVVGLVSGLLSWRGPAAILRLIVAVLVGVSVEGVLGAGPWTHVGIEVLERMKPPFADRDPAPAVPREGFMVAVRASGLHRSPTVVLGSASLSMLCSGDDSALGFQASAALCDAANKAIAIDGLCSAAVADAIPEVAFRVLTVREARNDQSAKSRTCQINSASHIGAPAS